MTIIWDGMTKSEILGTQETITRHSLADAAKAYDWEKVLTSFEYTSRLS